MGQLRVYYYRMGPAASRMRIDKLDLQLLRARYCTSPASRLPSPRAATS